MLICLLSLTTAGADFPAASLDPGRLIPEDMTVFVEIFESDQQLRRLQRSAAWNEIAALVPGRVLDLLEVVNGTGLKRAALGMDHSFLRDKTIFVLLLEAKDQAAAYEKAQAVAKESGRPVFRAGPFIGVADSPDTVDDVRDVARGDEDSLLDRADFLRFRERVTTGDVRFHVNLSGLLPLRPGVAEPSDAVNALFFAHLLHVAGRGRELSGFADLSRGLKIRIDAPVGRLPADRQFCAPTRPSPDVLAPTLSETARLSLRRDLSSFWEHVGTLVSEDARADLTKLRSNLESFTGERSVQAACSGLGTAFDVHLGRLPDEGPQPPNRYPVGALVAQVRNEELRGELITTFREVIRAVNHEASQGGKPQMALSTAAHKGVELNIARFPPAPNDDRDQAQVTMAIVGERLILASHAAIVRDLVDAAVEGRTRPREPGDVLRMRGAGVGRLLRDARAALIARMVVGNERTAEQASALLDRVGWYLERADELKLDLVFADGQARLDIDLIAPDLWKSSAKQDK